MNLDERIQAFELFFDALQSTSSRLEKEQEVKIFTKTFPELIEDWTYILETLDGKHPIGWTFIPRANPNEMGRTFTSVKKMIQYCENVPNKTQIFTADRERGLNLYGDFLAPIVNRTLRLGIGKSLLAKSDITPMLAKKYEGGFLTGDFVVTEKLDGNRCVAAFNKDSGHWEFYSRSGKPMKVNFDMSGFDTNFIYDGEVMSEQQTLLSQKRYQAILNDVMIDDVDMKDSQLLFNKTSGMINQHSSNKKGLVYNIFDIIDSAPYYERRSMLSGAVTSSGHSGDTMILPVLAVTSNTNKLKELLGRITQMGGEGIMLNRIDRKYEQKRSDALLKYKQVQFMDMRVIDLYSGTGKYEGLVGGICCAMTTDDKKMITCDVGSGLSDAQRIEWAKDPHKIVGKIVQIGYHELTQSEENIGTCNYSLRFPRLIKVREDKNGTSEY